MLFPSISHGLFPFENGSQQDRFRPYYVPGLVGLMSLGPGFFGAVFWWCKELPKYGKMGELTDQKLGFPWVF